MSKKIFVIVLMISAIVFVGCGGGGGGGGSVNPLAPSEDSDYIPSGTATGNEILILGLPDNDRYSNVKICGVDTEFIPLIMNGERADCYKAIVPAETVQTKDLEITYSTSANRPVYINIKGKPRNRVRDAAVNNVLSSYVEIGNNPIGEDGNLAVVAMSASIPTSVLENVNNGSSSVIEKEIEKCFSNGNWDFNYSYSCYVGNYGEAIVSDSIINSVKNKTAPATAFVFFDLPGNAGEYLSFYGYPAALASFARIPLSVIKSGIPGLTYYDKSGNKVNYLIQGNAVEGIKKYAESGQPIMLSFDTEISYDYPDVIACPFSSSIVLNLEKARTSMEMMNALSQIMESSKKSIEAGNYYLSDAVSF